MSPHEVIDLMDVNAELLAALKELEAALHKDIRSSTLMADTVEYHLDGQTMYIALNKARDAIAKAKSRG